MTWQRETIREAASYLQDIVASGAEDDRTLTLLRDLREILDPMSRTLRMRRERIADRELDQMDAHGMPPAGRFPRTEGEE